MHRRRSASHLLATLALASVAIAARPSLAATSWYASTTGLSTNAGTLASPWDLDSALSGHSGSVQAGDTIYLRGGTYTKSVSNGVAMYVASLAGTQSSPITIRKYQAEEPIIQDTRNYGGSSTLEITGHDLIVRDLTITNSGTDRARQNPPSPLQASDCAGPGAVPAGCFRPMGIEVYPPSGSGQRISIINNIIHDTGHGIGFWERATDSSLAYGNLIYNVGQQNSLVTREYGHGIYTKNDASTPKLIEDNMILNSFGLGIQGYPSSGTAISNYTIDSNIIANSGAPSYTTDNTRLSNLLFDTPGTCCGNTGNTFNDNVFYTPLNQTNNSTAFDTNFCLQCIDAVNHGTATITNNYIAGGIPALEWAFSSSGGASGNTVIAPATIYAHVNGTLVLNSAYSINNNTYQDGAAPLFVHVDGGGTRHDDTFSQWKSETGWDSSSTYTSGAPSGTITSCGPNAYESGRGICVAMNWAGASTVSLPLSSLGLVNGDNFEVRNAFDWYHTAVATGTYSSSNPYVSVSMTGLTVATPTGWSYTPPSTGSTFGAFIVRKV